MRSTHLRTTSSLLKTCKLSKWRRSNVGRTRWKRRLWQKSTAPSVTTSSLLPACTLGVLLPLQPLAPTPLPQHRRRLSRAELYSAGSLGRRQLQAPRHRRLFRPSPNSPQLQGGGDLRQPQQPPHRMRHARTQITAIIKARPRVPLREAERAAESLAQSLVQPRGPRPTVFPVETGSSFGTRPVPQEMSSFATRWTS